MSGFFVIRKKCFCFFFGFVITTNLFSRKHIFCHFLEKRIFFRQAAGKHPHLPIPNLGLEGTDLGGRLFLQILFLYIKEKKTLSPGFLL